MRNDEVLGRSRLLIGFVIPFVIEHLSFVIYYLSR